MVSCDRKNRQVEFDVQSSEIRFDNPARLPTRSTTTRTVHQRSGISQDNIVGGAPAGESASVSTWNPTGCCSASIDPAPAECAVQSNGGLASSSTFGAVGGWYALNSPFRAHRRPLRLASKPNMFLTTPRSRVQIEAPMASSNSCCSRSSRLRLVG